MVALGDKLDAAIREMGVQMENEDVPVIVELTDEEMDKLLDLLGFTEEQEDAQKSVMVTKH